MKTLKHKKWYQYMKQILINIFFKGANTLTNLTNNIQDQKNKKHKHTQQQYNVTYNKFKNLNNM